jgi:hypothetical protein
LPQKIGQVFVLPLAHRFGTGAHAARNIRCSVVAPFSMDVSQKPTIGQDRAYMRALQLASLSATNRGGITLH